MLRVMTYNVHSCRGTDGRLMPDRILAVIERAAPDVLALQELDVGQTRSEGLDQAAFLAERLGMECLFAAARACYGGHYGNAILSRAPVLGQRSAALPRLDERCEPRVVQLARVSAPFGALDVLNVHFGLSRRERRLQAAMLLGPDWLGDPTLSGRHVLCGDLNATPFSSVYRAFSRVLVDAQRGRRRATFPSWFPLLRIDHIFVGRGLAVHDSRVVEGPLARVASDHRPVVADLEPLPEAA